MPPPPHKHTPEISIVVPMYNVEKYVETCVNSILTQTFKDYELILIDDCSTDNTLEVVQKFNDPRIKILKHIKNFGENASRNFGLNVSTGKYVYFMDSDDAIIPNTIETLYNAIEQSQSDIVHMNAYFEAEQINDSNTGAFKTRKGFIGNPQPRFLSNDIHERIGKEYLQSGLQVMPWTKIQRRDFLHRNKLYFPEVILAGDVLFELSELLFAEKVQVIDACCYLYRQTPDQVTKASSKKILTKAILSLPKMISFLDETFDRADVPKILKIRCESFFVRMNYFSSSNFIRAYNIERLPFEEVNNLISEMVCKVGITSPDLVRILINALAEQTMITQNLYRNLNKK